MKINDLPVVNASKKISITITPKDVSNGNTKDPGGCAAAKACMREVPGCTAARVHLGRTYLQVDKKWVRFQTPEALRAEIISFDRGHEFQPGEYVLRAIPPSERPAGRRQGSNKPGARDKGSKNRTPKKARTKPHVVYGVRASGANR